MIERVIIRNFKGIKEADIHFNAGKNILVGNNGVGKSTIIEALSLALGYGYSQFELNQYSFHQIIWNEFKESHIAPEILIELYFQHTSQLAQFSGKNNTLRKDCIGLRFRCYFDQFKFPDVDLSKYDVIPYEYYTKERYWFSDTPVHQMQIPVCVQIIDSTTNYFNSRTNTYVSSLIKNTFDDSNNADFIGCIRRLKDTFETDAKIKAINGELSRSAEDVKKDLEISINFSSKIVWNSIVCPFLKKIPIEQIGQGDLCILKTLISIVDTKKTYKITILEEPESHLSHTKMYELLDLLLQKNIGQLFITTHNSFVANRLDIGNLIILTNTDGIVNAKTIVDDKKELSYFSKTPNFPTLRIALCKAALLVEGPTDEMIVEYCFRKLYEKHPFEMGIEVISVGGVQFHHYSKLIPMTKRVAIVTDNDRKTHRELVSYRSITENAYIKLFTDENIENYTLEVAFVDANRENIEKLSYILRSKRVSSETMRSLTDYLLNNKSEWSYRLLQSNDINFNVPIYIERAVKWACGYE